MIIGKGLIANLFIEVDSDEVVFFASGVSNSSETRKEEGCLQYDLIEDKDNKGTFFLIELWESVDHHNRHNGQDHLLDFRKDASKMMESSVEVYKGFKIY